MIDITDFLPKESPVVTAIYRLHEKELAAEDAKPRLGRIGGAAIGKPCDRYIWYAFRKCCKPSFSGQMHRLFETGHLEEPRFVRELRGIGCIVHDENANGEQFAVSAIGGHFGGYLDAAILGVPGAEKTWHVGEFKTCNDKAFKEMKKKGVLKAKPEHHAQMQIYMGLTGMKRALYLVKNKNDDALHAERVHFDKAVFDNLMAKAERIITANAPPARLNERPDWYQCRYCDAKGLCHGTAESALPIPSVNCRQCCHSTPTMDGNAAWTCSKHGRGLCGADQDRACDDHLLLPGLLYGCEPNGHGTNDDGHMYIEFIKGDGELFCHGRGKGDFSTEELRKLPLSTIGGDTLMSAAKSVMGATVEGYSQDDILTRYPESSKVWFGAAHEIATAWKKRYGEDLDLKKALGTVKDTDYNAVEMPGGRAVVHSLPGSRHCEIREAELCSSD